MTRRYRPAILASVIVSVGLGLSACDGGVGLTLLGVGAGAGVNHTLGGIAYKTFTVPAEDVHVATRNALKTMAIDIDDDSREDNGPVRKVAARTKDRDIGIEIEELTPRTTRLRVVAAQDLVFKDGATANEIIVQTAQALDDLEAAKARGAARSAAKSASARSK
jgi:hypothetical protein